VPIYDKVASQEFPACHLSAGLGKTGGQEPPLLVGLSLQPRDRTMLAAVEPQPQAKPHIPLVRLTI